MGEGPLFLGIDMGTGGARALVVRADGAVAASGASAVASLDAGPGRHEQAPEQWWRAAREAVGTAVEALRAAGAEPERIQALSADGTSGTLVALDARGAPVRPAILYNDGRAEGEAQALNEASGDFGAKLGYRFAASYALAKALWMQRHEPERFGETRRFLHHGDWVLGRIAGRFDVTDHGNALKTGYDLLEDRWPAWIERFPEIAARLPDVVAPGTRIGAVTASAAAELGLPSGVPVVAGTTDGTAGFLASGARAVGDTNTTLGTTLVFKRLADRLCADPQGLVYSHKLPGGRWLPGAASSTGGEWQRRHHGDADLAALDAAARPLLPTAHVAYPLARRGERFPFHAPEAEGFCEPKPPDAATGYAARLEGVALIERLAYEKLDALAVPGTRDVYATGGGTRSDLWMQLRADATGRTLHRPATPEAGFGAALLAAASEWFGDLGAAVDALVSIEARFEPDPARRAVYDEKFAALERALRERGWIEGQ